MNFLLHLMIVLDLYLILAASLNLLTGYAGLVSLCQAAFYGIGAYTTALGMLDLGLGFLPALTLGILVTVAWSAAISVAAVRLKSDYFILATLAFQVLVVSVLNNWIDLTHGPYGLQNIPRPTIIGVRISSLGSLTALYTVMALICLALLSALGKSPFGRALKAVREDEMAAATLGKHVAALKIAAFCISAGFAAVSGGLLATYLRYLTPTSFTFAESVFVLSAIIIGGAGNSAGPVVGAAVLVILPEVLRFVGIPDWAAPNVREILYGLAILVILRYRPQGILGEYRFT